MRHWIDNAGQYAPFGERCTSARNTPRLGWYQGPDVHPGSGGAQFGFGPFVLSRDDDDAPVAVVRVGGRENALGRTGLDRSARAGVISMEGPASGTAEATSRAASRKRLTLHSLRHGFASLLISQGLNVVFVSRQLGHANPNITLGIYAHLYAHADHAATARAALDASYVALTRVSW